MKKWLLFFLTFTNLLLANEKNISQDFNIYLKNGIELFSDKGQHLKSDEAILEIREDHFCCFRPNEKLSFELTYPQKKALLVTADMLKGNFLRGQNYKDFSELSFSGKVEGLYDNIAFKTEKLTWKAQEKEENDFSKIKKEGGKVLQKEGKIIAFGKSEFHYQNNISFSCNGEVVLDNAQKSLEAKGKEPLCFKNDELLLFADHLTLNYDLGKENEPLPKEVVFEGNIKLVSDYFATVKSYATCDKVHYFPQEKKMILAAFSPKKVLFWQADDSFSLSAKEIVINDKKIQGVGNVHFALSDEELNFIKHMFEPFLKNL